MDIEKLKRKAIFGLVAGLIYALILISIDYYFNEAIEWNKIAVKAVVFGLVLALILNFIQPNKKK